VFEPLPSYWQGQPESEAPMTKTEPIPYEPPRVTTYGTIQELTLGSNGTATPDILPCAPGTFQANSPSGITCKVSN
jgi:hypothetical protein